MEVTGLHIVHVYVAAGLSPHLVDAKVRFAPPHEQLPPPPATKGAGGKKTSHITFEDYHLTWSGIATSKSDPNSRNTCELLFI